MAEGLKSKTISGICWSALERFSLQGVQFLINIIMARLLLPSDYGLLAMLAIFLQISQAFVDGGFTNALIQRKNRNEIDFSTVFYFNILIAIVLYFVLYVSAPWIADFYHMPELVMITRLVALNLIISAFSAVHKTKLTISINFKAQSKASLSAAIISGTIGICMAYKGWGVWALVYQSLLNSLLLTGFLFYLLHWKPLWIFSLSSFKRLFSFGSKLLISNLIHTVYYNLYALIIGRKFSAKELGYYTRAEQFAVFPSSNLNAVISRVIFPVLSTIQDDDERLVQVYRKYIRLSSYIIFPLMIGLATLAKPIILVLLTEKWIGVCILLQILCFDWMFDHLGGINQNLLYVKGRSDLVLRLEIVKKTIALLILFSSIPLGLIWICLGRVLYSLIATYLNAYYTKTLIKLSFKTQLKDILPCLLISCLMGGTIWLITSFISSEIGKLGIGFISGIVSYFLFSYLFKIDFYKDFLLVINGNKAGNLKL